MFSTLLRSFSKPKKRPIRTRNRTQNRTRPYLEQLEYRWVPAPTSLNVNLDQFANLVGQGWQNGDLNKNNSAYAEGQVVPFRLAIEGLTPSAENTIHINYDFTAGGHKAYDFLATYDATQTNPAVDLCARWSPVAFRPRLATSVAF